MNRIILTLLLSMAQATSATYYIDYVAGSDSNNGTSKTTPWKHCPVMDPFSGSYTHADGDRFIFKGGVTWPNAALPLYITVGGAAGNHDYYGVDTAWYTGGSWSYPVFDAEGTPFTNWAGYHQENMIYVYGSQSRYVDFDNLKLVRWHVTDPIDNNTDSAGINCRNSGDIIVTNCYIGEWVIGSSDDGGFGVCGGYNAYPIDVYNCTIRGPISIDSQWVTDPDPGWFGFTAGTTVRDVRTVENCDLSYTTQGVWGIQECHNNHIHHIGNSYNPNVHENGFKIHETTHFSGNVVAYVYEGTLGHFIPGWSGASGHHAWVHNNVFFGSWPQMWLASTDFGSIGTDNEAWFCNNVVVDAFVQCSNGADDALVRANNIFISDQYTTLDAVMRTNNSPPINIKTNNVLMTYAQAAAYGMTAANNYRPVRAHPSVADQGLDFSGDPLALASPQILEFDIDFDGATRPSGDWDIGAYEHDAPAAVSTLRITPAAVTNLYID